MRKIVLTFICTLWTTGGAVAAAVTPAYKLGGSYASETTSSTCLEGHAGATLSNSGCKNVRQCQTDSDCGDNKHHICRRNQCEYQECTGITDTLSCSYSPMRSCVKNDVRDRYECRVTCTWDDVKEDTSQGFKQEDLYKRIQFEYKLWTDQANAAAFLSGFTEAQLTKLFKRDDINMMTCYKGKVQKCPYIHLDQSGSPDTFYDYIDSPCMPCSIATGGTWGVNGEEDTNKQGAYPFYTINLERLKDVQDGKLIDIMKYGGYARVAYYPRGCGDTVAVAMVLKSTPNVAYQLSHRIPLAVSESINTQLIEDEFAKVKPSSTKPKLIGLGETDFCMTLGMTPRLQSPPDEDPKKYYIYGYSKLMGLVYAPQQAGHTYAFDENGNRIYVNFNIPQGNLFCCMHTTNYYKDNNFSPCVRVSPK